MGILSWLTGKTAAPKGPTHQEKNVAVTLLAAKYQSAWFDQYFKALPTTTGAERTRLMKECDERQKLESRDPYEYLRTYYPHVSLPD